MLCGIGLYAVHPHADHSATSGDHTVLYKGSSAPWQTELQAFQKLLKTDASAARAELHAFAERIFGDHALVEEWVPLYFRIRKDGTTHLSDLKRVSELEIRMLERIDPEKYAEQIQHHQKKIKRSSVSRQKGNESAPTGALKGQWSSPTLTAFESGGEFFINFVNLLTTDLKAARAELNKYASQRYGDHPHKAEWTELVFRNFRDKKSKILDLMRLYELEKQMLTDIDPEKHADGIKNLERIIKIHERLQRNFERQGTPNPTIGVEFNLTTED